MQDIADSHLMPIYYVGLGLQSFHTTSSSNRAAVRIAQVLLCYDGQTMKRIAYTLFFVTHPYQNQMFIPIQLFVIELKQQPSASQAEVHPPEVLDRGFFKLFYYVEKSSN